jgi:hypothetical protein
MRPGITVGGKATRLNLYGYCGSVGPDAQHINLTGRTCTTPHGILSRDGAPNTPSVGFKLALEESTH